MVINPGSLAAQMPAGEDWVSRALKEIRDTIRENAAARSLEASSIGAGGLTVTSGGSITITGSGSLNVASGGLNSAGSISAATTITAVPCRVRPLQPAGRYPATLGCSLVL